MTFKGDFADYDAKLVDGRLEGTAKVASIRVDDPNLAGHLQTPDFFDAEQHPELRFVSAVRARRRHRLDRRRPDPARRDPPRGAHRHVSGPITDGYGNQRLGLDVETTINRRDFGIDWGQELPSGEQMLADDVLITANLALVQA